MLRNAMIDSLASLIYSVEIAASCGLCPTRLRSNRGHPVGGSRRLLVVIPQAAGHAAHCVGRVFEF